MKKLIWFVLILFVYTVLISAKPLTEPDLIKNFIEKEDYKKALDIIENSKTDTTFADSLAFFKAVILEKNNDIPAAIKIYSHLLINSKDSTLVNLSHKRLIKDIKNTETSLAIDFVSSILDSLSDKNLRKNFLNVLADIFERNLLYGEANDVYQTMLQDTLQVDTLKLFLKIAQNDIYLKEYKQSRTILDSLLTTYSQIDSSVVLYLKALTYFKEQNMKEANKLLLDLYLKYPNHPDKKEVIHLLAETCLAQKQYLTAWYLLDKLYKISSESQKFKLYDEILDIKKKFIEDKTATDQFRDFVPKWEVEKGEKTIIQQKSQ